MSRDATNIRGGFDGKVQLALKGATAPTDPVTAWAAAFTDMGWLTDDGIVGARSRDMAEVYAMGVTTAPVWQRVTTQESTIAVTFMETKAETLSLISGLSTSNMTSTAAVTGPPAVPAFITFIESTATAPTEYALGIDLTDGTYLYRRFWPRVSISDTGDQTYQTTSPVGYPITFRALVASDGSVCKHMLTGLTLPTSSFG